MAFVIDPRTGLRVQDEDVPPEPVRYVPNEDAIIAAAREHMPMMANKGPVGGLIPDMSDPYRRLSMTGTAPVLTPNAGPVYTPPPVAPAAPPPSVADRALATLTPPPATTVQAEAKAALAPKAMGPRPMGGGMPAGGMAGHRGALADADKAVQDQALHKSFEQAILTDTLQANAQAAVERQAEREKRVAEHQQLVDTNLAQARAAIDDAAATPDFGRLMHSPEGIVMAIGAALGGGAASRVNGQNPGQVALDNALARDFAKLKAEAEHKGEVAGRKMNLVQQMRSVFADREQADLVAEAAHREAAARQIEVLGSQSKIGDIQTAAKLAAAETREKNAALDDRIVAMAGQAAHAQVAATKEQRDYELAAFKANTERMGVQGTAADKAQSRLDTGTRAIASEMQQGKYPTAEAALDRADTDMRAGGTNIINTNPAANALAAKMPWIYSVLADDRAAVSQQSFASARNIIFNLRSGGAINESEAARLEQEWDNAGTHEARHRALGNLREQVNKAKDNIFRGAGPEATEAYLARTNASTPITGPTNVRFTPGVAPK